MERMLINPQILTDIADAIREKTSTTDLIKPIDMAEKIDAISGGGSEAVCVFDHTFTMQADYSSTGRKVVDSVYYETDDIINHFEPYSTLIVYTCEYLGEADNGCLTKFSGIESFSGTIFNESIESSGSSRTTVTYQSAVAFGITDGSETVVTRFSGNTTITITPFYRYGSKDGKYHLQYYYGATATHKLKAGDYRCRAWVVPCDEYKKVIGW